MILFGDLAEIKRSRGANSVVVETPSHPAGLPGARRHAGRGGKVELPGRTKSGFGLLITAATGLFLLWLSARVFRAALLLYGQRMGLRSVWKALREAN